MFSTVNCPILLKFTPLILNTLSKLINYFSRSINKSKISNFLIVFAIANSLLSCIDEITYKEEKKDFYYSVNLPIGIQEVYNTDDSVFYKSEEFKVDFKLFFLHKVDFNSHGILLTPEEFLFAKMTEKGIDFNPNQFQDYRAGVYSGKKWKVDCEQSKDCNQIFASVETSKFFVLLHSIAYPIKDKKKQNQVIEEFFYSYRELLVSEEETYK